MSPKAYVYVRTKFGKNIPHPETMKVWYRKSDLNAEPGLSMKSLEALEILSKDMMQKYGKPLVISIVFDEMAILRNMAWCRATNKFIGLVDEGSTNEDGEFTLANNVIVFMACGVNAYVQQPIGYNFIQTLKAEGRAQLLKKVIKAVAERGIKVANVTFDGYGSNCTMCDSLGAKLSVENGNYTTFFPNPHDGSRVYVIFDPSHMEKLVRNIIGECNVFKLIRNECYQTSYQISYDKLALQLVRKATFQIKCLKVQ